jgi:YggT family protein
MPDMGAIDFSPLVLIIGLNILSIILNNLAASTL